MGELWGDGQWVQSFFKEQWNILNLILVVDILYNSINILKSMEQYTLNGWILWYMNYISKIHFKKKEEIVLSLASVSLHN